MTYYSEVEQQLFEKVAKLLQERKLDASTFIFAEGLDPEVHESHAYTFERVVTKIKEKFDITLYLGSLCRQSAKPTGEIFGWRQYYLSPVQSIYQRQF